MDCYTPDGRRLDEPEEPVPARPTPGPWRYEYSANDDYDVPGRHNFILCNVSVDAGDQGRPQDYGGSLLEGALVLADDAENEANARLLTASPDLKHALEQMVLAFGSTVTTAQQEQALTLALDAIVLARSGAEAAAYTWLDDEEPDGEPAVQTIRDQHVIARLEAAEAEPPF